MPVNPISFPEPRAFSGGADFTPLANLGNVYREAQGEAAKSRALSQLGADPNANAQALISSGVPSLAQMGLTLQQQQVANKRADEQLGFQREAAKRAAAADEEDSPEVRTKKAINAKLDPASPPVAAWIAAGGALNLGSTEGTVIEKQTNPVTGETSFVRIKKAGPEGPIATGAETEKPAIDPSITGDEFLSKLDPARANTVKSIAEGRQQPPSGYALKNPQITALLRDVAQYEPGFDMTLWKARNAMLTSATSGKIGQGVASFNTAIGHLGALDKAIDGLDNTRFPMVNTSRNTARAAYDPDFANKLNQFEITKTAVVDELTRAFRGTGGNVHDLVEWSKNINSAQSPTALKGAVKQVVELLRSRIEALGDQYNRGMQTKVPKDALDLLSPKAKATIKHLSGEDEAVTPTWSIEP